VDIITTTVTLEHTRGKFTALSLYQQRSLYLYIILTFSLPVHYLNNVLFTCTLS